VGGQPADGPGVDWEPPWRHRRAGCWGGACGDRLMVRRIARGVLVGVAAAVVGMAAGAAPASGQGAEKVLRLPIRTDGPKSLDPAKGSTQYDNMATCQVYECL